MLKLSILIPAYSYPRGVDRILSTLCPLPYGVEILIYDDSPDDLVKNVVTQHLSEKVIYVKNFPTKGAINNWNSLLEMAQGQYVILLHHDECPIGESFLNDLLEILSHTSSDVLMMDVFLLDSNGVEIRKHVPRFIRELVINFLPGYLFNRNVIGPTGSLVIRREILPKYDTNLKWFVDVDFYFRLRRETKRWETVFGVEIGSIRGEHESITEKLKNGLVDVIKSERMYLNKIYPTQYFWINLQVNPLSRFLEFMIWAGVRLIQVVFLRR